MKTINPLQTQRVIKALKPRNTVIVALKNGQGAQGGAHGKTRGALRRAEKMAVARELADYE
jgi:hypothetical protein